MRPCAESCPQLAVLNLADVLLIASNRQHQIPGCGDRTPSVKSLRQSVHRCDREHNPPLSHLITNVRLFPSFIPVQNFRLFDDRQGSETSPIKIQNYSKIHALPYSDQGTELRASRHITPSNYPVPSSNLVGGRRQLSQQGMGR